MKAKINRKRIYLNLLTYIILIVIIFLVGLPIISMVGTALKSSDEVLSSTSLLPRRFHFESFLYVLDKTTYSRNLANSFLVSICTTVVCVVIASMAGYAVSRFKSRLFNIYSILVLVLQMFPLVLLLIPLFLIFKFMNLTDTLFSVILSYLTINLPFSIWMLRGFFNTIPIDIEEAALIDGCSRFRSFAVIILPISAPGIATVGMFTFIFSWKEYMLASIFLRSDSIKTATLGLQDFITQYDSDWPSLMAASTMTTIPVIIFLVIAQKYLIQGLTAGSVKG